MNASRLTVVALGAALGAAPAFADVVTFDNGAEGWSIQNAVTIEPAGGNPGANLYHYQIDTFGVTVANSTNPAFIGDYGAKGPVTVSLDIKVNQIWTFQFGDVPRDLVVEFRSHSLAQNGYPWASVWANLGTLSSGMDWTTMGVHIADPTSATLPAGWGGYGDEDPETYEPILPAGLTFADVMANVDEIVFTTFVPGYFFGFTNYDLAVDNISIVPAPGAALPLLGVVGVACRRRRR